MKQKLLIPALLAVCMLLIVSCKKEESAPVVEAAPVVDVEQIKLEIQALEDAYAAASNARDVEGIMPYYADDIVSYPADEPAIVGKEAMKASLLKDLAEYPKGSTVSYAVKDVFVSNDGNLVNEIGSYTAVDSLGKNIRTGHYISVFEKREGKYVCIRDMGASDMPKKKE